MKLQSVAKALDHEIQKSFGLTTAFEFLSLASLLQNPHTSWVHWLPSQRTFICQVDQYEINFHAYVCFDMHCKRLSLCYSCFIAQIKFRSLAHQHLMSYTLCLCHVCACVALREAKRLCDKSDEIPQLRPAT